MSAEVTTGPAEGAPPFALAMLTLGDRWNLLILQHAFLSRASRFSDWQERLGVAASVLSDRLTELVSADILATEPYEVGNRPREEYRLTERGRALWSLLVAMWVWERAWVPGHAPTPVLEHRTCGSGTAPDLGCGACGAHPVTARDTRTVDRSDGAIVSGSRARHHRRSTRAVPPGPGYHDETFAVVGDRWSTLLLGAALLGVRRFADLRARLQVSPSVLSDRLRTFVGLGILRVAPDRSYRLTEKGLAFFPVVAVMVGWADDWLDAGRGRPGLDITHVACGEQLRPLLFCDVCGEAVRRETLRFVGQEPVS